MPSVKKKEINLLYAQMTSKLKDFLFYPNTFVPYAKLCLFYSPKIFNSLHFEDGHASVMIMFAFSKTINNTSEFSDNPTILYNL